MVRNEKNNFISRVFVYCVPLIFQLTNLWGKTILYIGVYLFIFLSFYLLNKKKTIDKRLVFFLIPVTIAYIIMPIFSRQIQLSTLFYYYFIIIFIFVIDISSKVVSDYETESLKWLLIFNSIPLLYQIFSYHNSISNEAVMSVFNGDRFSRVAFGYSHPNFAAMFIVMEILMIYVIMIDAKKKHTKIIGAIAIGICLIPLFATGSRTATYSLSLFMISEILFHLASKYSKYRKEVYSLLLVTVLLIGLIEFGSEILTNSSGRDVHFLNNFRVLQTNGDLWFGAGGGSTSKITAVNGINYSDNWYMTSIINSGLLGFLTMIITFIYMFVKILRAQINETYGVSLFILLFTYSFAENMLFVPGVALSWLAWTFILPNFRLNKKKHFRSVRD